DLPDGGTGSGGPAPAGAEPRGARGSRAHRARGGRGLVAGPEDRAKSRGQRPTRALWARAWDVGHVGRDQRPTPTREAVEWDVMHVASRGWGTRGPGATDSP